MEIGNCRVQRDTGARRKLVAQHDAGEEFAPVAVSQWRGDPAVEISQQRRQDGHSRVALGQHMAIVRVEGVDGGRPRERGAGEPGATAVEEHPCVPVTATHLGRCVRIDNGRDGGA